MEITTTTTTNSANKTGYYTKIGNSVTVWVAGMFYPTGMSGNVEISGLPFSASSLSGDGYSGSSMMYRNMSTPANANNLVIHISSAASTLKPYWTGDTSTTAYQRLQASHIHATASDLYMSLTYPTV